MPRSLAYEPRNALNAICPYFTMFPLEYPLRVLKSHYKKGPVVMDPFCGRGTTLFAARQMGLVSRGIDSSPVAVAIARAKLCKIDVDSTLNIAQQFIDDNRVSDIPDTEFFRHAFSPLVLEQICAVRAALLKTNRDNDSIALLRATMLGCLHGPRSKSIERQAYLSNQMPRTFCSKPDYSVKYWKAHDMTPPQVDIISVLRRKLSLLQRSELHNDVSIADVRLGDSRYAKSLPMAKRNFSLVITSPPYYGMRTYVEDQWLRNWFLGGSNYVQYGKKAQLQHTGQDVFTKSLGTVWKNMARTRAEDLHMYIRFGSIPSKKNVNTKQMLRDSLDASGVSWQVISTRPAATAASGRRQAGHMSINSVAATEFDFHVCRY